ncbi:ChaN family lipoprotein [Flavobacterium filum]|uniref:ChaN family lipoprotein n=1 Tax=Flavobacterium TaxID=237 RepID=UPI00047EEB37|nr:ChaN family lipoprotein [Flavobacterium filum]
MKISFRILLLLGFYTSITFAQTKMPYQVFTKNGKKSSYEKMLKAAEKAELVLFGEHHDNSVVHWLQLELTKDLAEKRALVLGAEMIEADNQKQLNQYVKGEINQKQFDSTARLWNNYKTDYKPLVDFAKEKNFPFIATNVPRKYANVVFRKDFAGLDELTSEEKSWMAPLPIPFDISLPGYQKMLEMMGGHAGEKMPKAQALKDATMAYFIVQNLKNNTVFIHYNGTYHSDFFEGINWYVNQYRKNTSIVTIATVEQKDISKVEAEHLNKADFILVIDEDVTKTY